MRTKLSPAMIERARELREQGLSDQAIYTELGIDQSTFYRWIQRGEKGKKPYSEFYAAIKKGEKKFEQTCVNGILEQGKKGSWQALAWLLERRFPAVYAKKDNFNVQAQVSWVDVVRNHTKSTENQ